MMKTNFSLLFYMKKQKNYNKGVAPIYMRITVNGKRAESATGRSCEPDRWSCKSGRSIGTKVDSRSLNSFLDQLRNMVYDAHGALLKSGHQITAVSIRNIFMGREVKSQTLIQAITQHNEKVEALVGKEYVQGTLNRYKVLKKHLEIFLLFKYDVKDLDMRNIDISFLNEFDYYLKSEKSCANNYTVKMIKNRQKTNIRSAIPLLPFAVNIIEKYKNHPLCLNMGLVLPVPSNQKMNEYLKEIEDRCEIGKKLTAHIARHTFATTVTLLNGVPIESVSQMLGHTNIRTTLHYAKILDIKVGAEMALLKKKLAII